MKIQINLRSVFLFTSELLIYKWIGNYVAEIICMLLCTNIFRNGKFKANQRDMPLKSKQTLDILDIGYWILEWTWPLTLDLLYWQLGSCLNHPTLKPYHTVALIMLGSLFTAIIKHNEKVNAWEVPVYFGLALHSLCFSCSQLSHVRDFLMFATFSCSRLDTHTALE